MARLEWAHIEAFDNEARRPITTEDLSGRQPAQIHLRLQPHLTLLQLGWPLDEFLIKLHDDSGLRGEASNAVENPAHRAPSPTPRLLKRRSTCLAVHRHRNVVYYKRLQKRQFNLLTALQKGASLETAAQTLPTTGSAALHNWFKNWSALGWFYAASRRNPTVIATLP